MLSLVGDRKPVIDTGTRAKGGGLDVHLTNLIIAFHAFVVDLDDHIVTSILDIDVKYFVPFGVLARLCSSLVLLHSILNLYIGIHSCE